MHVFTPESRAQLRAELIEAARDDPNIIGAALTGSAALDHEDRWSDIDLALSVSDRAQAVHAWTERMYADCGAVHHVDVMSRNTLFRVYLLADTLQVDIAFWRPDEFGATAPSFRLLFGSANEQSLAGQPHVEELIGYAWLYALHARSSICRGRVWQAEYMIHLMRDATFAIACARNQLPTSDGRGMDALPADVRQRLSSALVRSLEPDDLWRAFRGATDALLFEIDSLTLTLDDRLAGVLTQLAQRVS